MNYTADEYTALVTIKDGIVHLATSYNPDAACCNDDETGTIIQREAYHIGGWNEPKDNPALATKFWDVWLDWNGMMIGGIHLDDDFTYEAAEKEIAEWGEKVTPAQIKGLPDGNYVVIPN